MSKQRASLRDRPLPQATVLRETDDAVLGKQQKRQEIINLPLRDIMPNRQQPRTQPGASALQELAESIQQHGVLEPVLVREIPLTEYEGAGRRYELIAGERRWRASMLAGQATIPVIVASNSTDDRAMLELAIIENLQRENLHPLDEAMAFGRMNTDLGYSYAQIAERLGKSKGYVQNRIRLLQLDEDLQHLVAERPDTLKHVGEIARLTDPTERAALIAAVRDDALSFAMTQARVQELLSPPPILETPVDQEQSYSREYERDKKHYLSLSDVPQEPQSYSREYEREEKHNLGTGSDRESLAAQADIGRGGLLSNRERAVIAVLTNKFEQAITDPSRLTDTDREMLLQLEQRLSTLLRGVQN